MPTLASQRAAIATALSTVAGLRVQTDGLWPDAANLPGALIKPAGDNEPMTLDLSVYREAYEVTVITQISTLERGQKSLDALHDGVVAALLAGLSSAQLITLRRQEYGVLEIDDAEYTGFTLRVELLSQ